MSRLDGWAGVPRCVIGSDGGDAGAGVGVVDGRDIGVAGGGDDGVGSVGINGGGEEQCETEEEGER